MRKKLIFFIIFLVSLAATIITILYVSKDVDEPLKKITILLDWTPNTNHTGIYVAQYLGYFKDEGLAVKIEQPPQESSTALVAAEKVEFSIGFQDFLAPALTSDTPLPIKAIAAITQHNTSGIICKKSSNINTAADLEFKNYCTFDNFIEIALIKHCVNISGGRFCKVNLIHSQTDNIAATFNKNIDATWGYFGIESVIAKHFNIENNFLFFKDIDPVLDFYSPILISNLNFLEKQPETVKKVLKALSKGYLFAAKYPKESADILVKCVPELDYDIILESQKFMSEQYVNDSTTWGVFNPDRWNSFFDWLFEKNIINKKIIHNTSFTNEFLPGIL